MPSLYADYCREKGMLVVETEKGFITAYIHSCVCFVDNLYVKPEYRGSSLAVSLAIEISRLAREKGCTEFAAEIYKSDPTYARNLKLHQHFGMKIVDETEYKVITSKRIDQC